MDQPRRAKNRWGRSFISFLPAISTKAATAIRQTIRGWRMASTRTNQRLEDLARLANPVVRGWLNYYGRFYRSRCVQVLRHFNEALGKWAQRKYTRFRRRERAAMHWLGGVARRATQLFVLWQQGVRPEAGVEEPDEARVSRPVLRGRRGASPLRYSPQHLRSQRKGRPPRHGQPDPLHRRAAQAPGQCAEERRCPTVAAVVPRLHAAGGTGVPAVHRRQGRGPVQAPGSRADAAAPRGQSGADDRRPAPVSTGLGQLLQLQPVA